MKKTEIKTKTKKKLTTFEEISTELKKRVGDIEVTPENLILILQYVLEVVELTKVDSNDKKIFAISLVKEIIEESDMNNKQKKICIEMINNGVISKAIDIIVLASKNKIKINQKNFKIHKLSKKISKRFRKATTIQNRYSNRKRQDNTTGNKN